MAYAQNTEVSTERSKAEIERTLLKYGADQFQYATDQTMAGIMFRMKERHIKFVLQFPDRNSRAFTHTPGRGVLRTKEAAFQEWEQACRSKWRSLFLVIKAKLEAIDSGISIFDQEFMANIVLPDKRTVGEFMLPQINEAYKTGTMPAMLPLLLGKGE